jgi:hypothetical protein
MRCGVLHKYQRNIICNFFKLNMLKLRQVPHDHESTFDKPEEESPVVSIVHWKMA